VNRLLLHAELNLISRKPSTYWRQSLK